MFVAVALAAVLKVPVAFLTGLEELMMVLLLLRIAAGARGISTLSAAAVATVPAAAAAVEAAAAATVPLGRTSRAEVLVLVGVVAVKDVSLPSASRGSSVLKSRWVMVVVVLVLLLDFLCSKAGRVLPVANVMGSFLTSVAGGLLGAAWLPLPASCCFSSAKGGVSCAEAPITFLLLFAREAFDESAAFLWLATSSPGCRRPAAVVATGED